MRLSEALSISRIQINPLSADKNDLIDELIDLSFETGGIQNRDEFRRSVFEREALQSTGLANGLAIPHAKISHAKKLMVCLGVCQSGIDFDALDHRPTYFIFLIAIPEHRNSRYLRLLSQITRIFGQSHIRERVLAAESPDDILQIIRDAEHSAEG
ncbi:MAG: PTS sugar transporter subunit IIA [Candidatus Poribacteria bacterium]|nr:PTS sugar transporter subunit IIA [Candidatus Poribacteria bacterium]